MEQSDGGGPSPVEKCEDNCNAILFADLVSKFETIERTRGNRKNKLDVIFTKELRDLIQGQSIFPLVRLLVPLHDTERQRYGLKQAAVAKTYVDALQLNRSSADAQRLIHWKDPTKAQSLGSTSALTGDFCSVLEAVLSSRVGQGASQATLGDINALLDGLTQAYGEAGKVSFIRENVLTKFNAREQKWLMRIIFQDLKIGLKLDSVLGFLSPWASQCFDECSDLRMICEGGRGKQRPKGLFPHSPFAPMLAKGFPNTGQLVEVERAMGGNPFVMDVKLDGERMLCHVSPGAGCKLLTRNGNDYTEKYRRLASDVTGVLRGCQSFILDGEVCAFDSSTGRFVAFGSNRAVGNSENNDETASSAASPLRLVYIVFDVVYAEGAGVATDVDQILREYASEEARGAHSSDSSAVVTKSDLPPSGGELTQLPLFARRMFLQKRLTVIPDRVIHMKHSLVLDSDVAVRQSRLEAFFNDMMEAGEEGLVVKSWLSTYELGEKSRSKNASWIKMKPEYSNNMTDLDLIILGGYHGEGKSIRAEGISHFLLGVKDEENSTEDDVKYLTVGKIGTGYTFAELEELRERLNPFWRPWPEAGAKLPPHFSPWKIGKRDDIPHVWIPPDKSCIVETRCAEITVSTNFAIGLTCRFPRASRIRYDKEISGVMTSSQFIEAKNRKRTMGSAEDAAGEAAPRRPKRSRVPSAAAAAAPRGRAAAPTGASYVIGAAKDLNLGNIFGEQVFCVLENTFNIPVGKYPSIATRSMTSEKFIDLLRGYGGIVVANPIQSEAGSSVIVCGNKKTLSIQNNIASKKFDVIDFCYILECVEAGHLVPPKTRHYVGMSAETTRKLLNGNDLFGDSLTEPICEADLASLLQDMDYAMDKFDSKRARAGSKMAPLTMTDMEKHILYSEIRRVYEHCRDSRSWVDVVKSIECDEERETLCSALIDQSRRCLFCETIVYVDKAAGLDVGSRLWRAAQRLMIHGAVFSADLSADVTHVLFDENGDEAQIENLKTQIRHLRYDPSFKFEKELVGASWVEKCISDQKVHLKKA